MWNIIFIIVDEISKQLSWCEPLSSATTKSNLKPWAGVKQTAFNKPSMLMIKSKDAVNSKWRQFWWLSEHVFSAAGFGPVRKRRTRVGRFLQSLIKLWPNNCSSNPAISPLDPAALGRRGELCSAGVSGVFGRRRGKLAARQSGRLENEDAAACTHSCGNERYTTHSPVSGEPHAVRELL